MKGEGRIDDDAFKIWALAMGLHNIQHMPCTVHSDVGGVSDSRSRERDSKLTVGKFFGRSASGICSVNNVIKIPPPTPKKETL